MTSTFQVDLHGVVDLLARHLYSSPGSTCASSCRTGSTRSPRVAG
ncbi:hypothetical protein NKG05_00555 [Oerskovia sp. M15]